MKVWGQTLEGREVHLYSLANASGMEVDITDFGGTVVRLTAPDGEGRFADVVLGYSNLSDYLEPGRSPYFGSIIGRVGNRIAKGSFTLDGKTYVLAKNDGPNSLHGGLRGFDKVVWEAEEYREEGTSPDQASSSLQLRYVSKDGEEGFPGALETTVRYTLSADNSLRIDYKAIADAPTPVNLTNHSYFNLEGEGNGDILGHLALIDADRFTPVDSTLIPTGGLRAVAGTPFDFTQPRPIGERIDSADEQLRLAGGYDHNWVLNGKAGTLRRAARVVAPSSGRVLEVWTTEPGVQFYTGNFLPRPGSGRPLIGKGGRPYGWRGGFCLETQRFPDSPNRPEFPSIVLRPGEVYESTTVFSFPSISRSSPTRLK